MEEWKTYSFEEAHKHFAQSIKRASLGITPEAKSVAGRK
jgi:hypothetical protein